METIIYYVVVQERINNILSKEDDISNFDDDCDQTVALIGHSLSFSTNVVFIQPSILMDKSNCAETTKDSINFSHGDNNLVQEKSMTF